MTRGARGALPGAAVRGLLALPRVAMLALALLAPRAALAFDHDHAAWDALLKRHVVWLADGTQSRVDYAAFGRERQTLDAVLAAYSAVPRSAFDGWSGAQRMAFLINAYNAFTIELVLTRYPDLKSIKELGGFLQSPWRMRFFRLLGETRTLDWIEHEQLRPQFDDPRVHAAINCASIGCPALRAEAFTATRLPAQLDDGMLRFMRDRTRNRVRDGRLEVSLVFKWFGDDFTRGRGGYQRLEDVFARYANQLSDDPAERARLRARAVPIGYLDYDWSLNAVGR